MEQLGDLGAKRQKTQEKPKKSNEILIILRNLFLRAEYKSVKAKVNQWDETYKKLSVEERQGIPHHLLDVLDVNQDATVAWYQELARKAVTEIHGAGKHAIIVGGTGLYIKSILDDLNFPDTDAQVRQRLTEEAKLFGIVNLFERLAQLDPAAAAATTETVLNVEAGANKP